MVIGPCSIAIIVDGLAELDPDDIDVGELIFERVSW
jgi:hypothetical protein